MLELMCTFIRKELYRHFCIQKVLLCVFFHAERPRNPPCNRFRGSSVELSRYPAMFCNSNCGSCIAEDTKIATIRVDLAQLNRLCAETNPSCVPAEAVRAVDSQDEAREENIGCQEPLRNAGCSGADTKPLTVTQCPQDELQAFVSPEVSRQLEVCPESATDSCGGGSDDFHEAPLRVAQKVTVEQFLRRHGFKGINVPKRSLLSSTYALHKAAEMADQELVVMLLSEGADPLLINSSGRTAADVAKKKDNCGSHAHVFNLLVDARSRKIDPSKAGGS